MKGKARLIEQDGQKKCYCTNCDTFHNCTEHFVTNKNKHGFSHSCKATTKNYYAPVPQFTAEQIIKMESDRMLKNLGYDLTSPIPVYEQFLIKHDL